MQILFKQISLKKAQTIALLLFVGLFLYFGLPSLYQRISWCDGYALGDWMINYQDGGFKRRGLSGSFFILVSEITGIYVGKLVFIFILSMYLMFSSMLVFYFRRIKFDFYLLLLFLLPTVLLFPINDLYAFGRKEILFYNIFLFFIISYTKTNVFSWRYILILSLLLFITTFFHELVIFYVPYILLIYFKDLILNKKGSLIKIFIIGFSSFLPALSIFLFGAGINEGHSWEIFHKMGVSENIMHGIFSWPKEGFGSDQVNSLHFALSKNYPLYGISYLITLILFFLLLLKHRFFKFNFLQVFSFHIILMAISFPIFFLTIDWGRWLNIHFICMLFFVSTFYQKNEVIDHFTIKNMLSRYSSIPFIRKLLILIILTFGFMMQHVDVGFKLGQNNLLLQLRDLFWNVRHFNF